MKKTDDRVMSCVFVFFLIVIFSPFEVVSQNNTNLETWDPPHPGGEGGPPPRVELERSHIEMNPGDIVEISITVWKPGPPRALTYEVYRVLDLHSRGKDYGAPTMEIPEGLRINVINVTMEEVKNTGTEYEGYTQCRSRIVIDADPDLSLGVYYLYFHGIFEPSSPSVHVWLEVVVVPEGYKIRQEELFPDKTLEIAVRRELGRGIKPVTEEDFSEQYSLDNICHRFEKMLELSIEKWRQTEAR